MQNQMMSLPYHGHRLMAYGPGKAPHIAASGSLIDCLSAMCSALFILILRENGYTQWRLMEVA